MKNLFFAALAALSFAAAVLPAEAATPAGLHNATVMQQTGAYGGD
ncbi:MAG TPA: hypothetical protein VHB27_10235 [Rhodopila sp.]|nr:hypothetical protein [Rhodopila sp.]HVY15600.1 hypothetical protein [Rhodopila sp.]